MFKCRYRCRLRNACWLCVLGVCVCDHTNNTVTNGGEEHTHHEGNSVDERGHQNKTTISHNATTRCSNITKYDDMRPMQRSWFPCSLSLLRLLPVERRAACPTTHVLNSHTHCMCSSPHRPDRPHTHSNTTKQVPCSLCSEDVTLLSTRTLQSYINDDRCGTMCSRRTTPKQVVGKYGSPARHGNNDHVYAQHMLGVGWVYDI